MAGREIYIHPDSFEDAVVAAVNHDGDSDSTGAVCGNIMGALLGRNAIPEHYTKNLELLDVIEEIAEDLYTGCVISGTASSIQQKSTGGASCIWTGSTGNRRTG